MNKLYQSADNKPKNCEKYIEYLYEFLRVAGKLEDKFVIPLDLAESYYSNYLYGVETLKTDGERKAFAKVKELH